MMKAVNRGSYQKLKSVVFGTCPPVHVRVRACAFVCAQCVCVYVCVGGGECVCVCVSVCVTCSQCAGRRTAPAGRSHGPAS